MKRNPVPVCCSLLAAALFLLPFPMEAQARRPQDTGQEVLVISQRRVELTKFIEGAERDLHIARETVRQGPDAAKVRERMLTAQQAFQKLVAEGRKSDDPALTRAREDLQQAHRAYAEFADSKLADDPETKERIRTLERWKAERARIELLLKRNAEASRVSAADAQP